MVLAIEPQAVAEAEFTAEFLCAENPPKEIRISPIRFVFFFTLEFF